MLFFLILRREYEENIILFINVHLLFITNINWRIRLFIQLWMFQSHQVHAIVQHMNF